MSASHWLTRYDPDDGEPYGTVCRCSIGRDHDGSEVVVPHDPVGCAVEALAVLLSQCRTHNPMPTEVLAARMFIDDMVASGWREPGGDDA
jgi:hypothetical protein